MLLGPVQGMGSLDWHYPDGLKCLYTRSGVCTNGHDKGVNINLLVRDPASLVAPMIFLTTFSRSSTSFGMPASSSARAMTVQRCSTTIGRT